MDETGRKKLLEDYAKTKSSEDDLLLTPAELEGEYQVRRMLTSNGNQDAAEQLIGLLEKTTSNEDFFTRLKGWMAAFEKDGYSLTR